MENKAHALAAGAFVLAITALLVAMALWLTRDVASTTRYELATGEAVTGLQPQAAVRFKGVTVGKVTSIRFDPDQRGHVLVTLAVNPDTPVTRSTFATLAFQGVTGLSFVQLDDDGSSTEPPPPGPHGVPRIPLHPNVFGQLSDQVGGLIGKVDQAVDRLNEVLGPANQAALARSLEQLGAAAQATGELAQGLRSQFDPARMDLPGLVRQAGATLRSTEAAATEVRRGMASLDALLGTARQGLVRITGPGGVVERLDEGASTVTRTTLPQLQKLGEDASRTLRRIDRVAGSLGENPQALLYGDGAIPPGPGEPGFVAPATDAAPSH